MVNFFGLTGIGTWLIFTAIFGCLFWLNYKSYKEPNNPVKTKNLLSLILCVVGFVFIVLSLVGLVLLQTAPGASQLRKVIPMLKI